MTEQGNAPAGQSVEAAPKPDQTTELSPLEIHNRKLLEEKKKVQQERDALLAEKRARDEEEARKRGDFETLIKTREAELAKEVEKRKSLEETFERGQKLSAVVEALGGNLEPKWYKLIDVSRVPLNPETGEVDKMAVASLVESLKREWPEMVRSKGSLPANAPQGINGGSGTISRAEWMKLSYAKMREYKPEQIID